MDLRERVCLCAVYCSLLQYVIFLRFGEINHTQKELPPFTNYFARGISAGEKMMTPFSGLTWKKVNLPTYVSEPLEKSC